jgi:DNA-binding transcriptional regulator PaaX
MNSDRKLEERMEAAVISELRRQPLYAIELITALGGNKDAVRGAVERLAAGGLICVPRSDARFELV